MADEKAILGVVANRLQPTQAWTQISVLALQPRWAVTKQRHNGLILISIEEEAQQKKEKELLAGLLRYLIHLIISQPASTPSPKSNQIYSTTMSYSIDYLTVQSSWKICSMRWSTRSSTTNRCLSRRRRNWNVWYDY